MKWLFDLKPKRSIKDWKRRDKIFFVAIVLLITFNICIGSGLIHSPFYVNITSSAPMGVYMISNDQELKPNVFVMVKENHRLEQFYGSKRPPQLLLKHIAGMPGDIMTVTDSDVRINTESYPTLSYTSNGMPLQHLPNGIYTLSSDEYFVANIPIRSYDSRYFGPVKRDEIQSVVTPVWLFGEGVVEFVNQWENAKKS